MRGQSNINNVLVILLLALRNGAKIANCFIGILSVYCRRETKEEAHKLLVSWQVSAFRLRMLGSIYGKVSQEKWQRAFCLYVE